MIDDMIVRIQATRVDVPLRSNFVISRADLSTRSQLSRIVVKIETDNGAPGFGEGVAIPSVTGFLADGLEDAVRSILAPALTGLRLVEAVGASRTMDRVLVGNYPAKAAVEMAALDALGKAAGLPVGVLIGGRNRSAVPVTASLGFDAPEAMAEKASDAVEQGVRVIKLKLKCDKSDRPAVALVRESVGRDVKLRLDANAGYRSPEHAIDELAPLLENDIYLVEQPLPAHDLRGMAEVRRRLGANMLADESASTPVDVPRLLAHDAADVIDIKVQAAGGLYPATEMAAAAGAAGMSVLVGSRMETGIGTAAGLQLMSALPDLHHACDVKTSDNYVSSLIYEDISRTDGVVNIPELPGLGVTIDESAIAEYAARPFA